MIGPDITRIARNSEPTLATLQVDIIADLVCPWSFLGKKRLDDALAAVHGPSLVSWHPFQINPEMPDSGMPLDEYIATKIPDPKNIQPAMDRLTAIGKEADIDFRFDLITRVPNTLNAHRLMNFAETQRADPSSLAEKILSGFFSHGLDISDRDVLVQIGSESGLEASDILSALEDEKSKSIVLSQEARVRHSGVTGVPDFLINKRLFVIGAQRTENLINVFDRVMFGEESDLPVAPTVH